MSDDATSAGQAALDAWDRALAQRPKRGDQEFAEATRHLCLLRGLLIQESRAASGHRAALDTVNALISVGLAGQFPLGHAPWPAIEHARQTLADLVASRGAAVDRPSPAL